MMTALIISGIEVFNVGGYSSTNDNFTGENPLSYFLFQCFSEGLPNNNNKKI
jgi:hypothetical protein